MTSRGFIENGLCTQTNSVLDSLPVRGVGPWAYDKIYRLVQYFGIFANGMKNQCKGLNYVEICSGPGLEIDGTALSIITHPVFPELRKALFVDASVQVVEALTARIANTGPEPDKPCAAMCLRAWRSGSGGSHR